MTEGLMRRHEATSDSQIGATPDPARTPEGWRRVRQVLDDVLHLAPEDRGTVLAQSCGDDDALRREVESLLAAHDAAGTFIDRPALAFDEASPAVESRLLGAYRLERLLGRGGMGAVYLAQRADQEFEQRVAVKVLKRGMDTDEIVRRFHSERQILAGLEHPHIARLIDGGRTEDGRPYLVMEAVDGKPIDTHCDAEQLSVGDRLGLFLKVCRVVEFAHRHLVVHRDLKPSNILITAEGEPKLLDFGIAKLLDRDALSWTLEPTEPGLLPMTPEYASPEQVRGERITTSSDVYSLGVLLYRLLSGAPPYRFKRRTPAEIERVVGMEEPAPPSARFDRRKSSMESSPSADCQRSVGKARRLEPHQLRRRLSGDLDHIVMKALRKEPELRYRSVQELAQDLECHLAQRPVAARQGNHLYRAGRFLRRYRLWVSIAAAFLLLVSGFAATSFVQYQRIFRERNLAQQERSTAQLERQRAEQVSTFLVELFELSDPEKSRGRTLSAREILDRGATRVGNELQGQTRLQSDLMRTMGRVYQGLGLYDEAEALLADALDNHRDLHGSRHLEVARTLETVTDVFLSQGDHEAAEQTGQEALILRRELLPADHPELARSLHQSGRLRRASGDYPAAESLFRQALAMRRSQIPPSQEEIADSLHELGFVLFRQAEYGEAEAIYRQALALRQQLFGDQHPDVAASLNDLALLLGKTRRYGEAAEVLDAALGINYQWLGREHPEVAALETNLAGMLVELSRFEEAERLAQNSLELRRRLLGEGHFLNASTLLTLARIRFLRGDLDAAESHYRLSLTVLRGSLGDRHPHSAHPLLWLGRVELARGSFAAAEPLLREALAIWRATLPEDHLFVARAEGALGACLVARGHREEGRPLLEHSYSVLIAQIGEQAEFARWVRRHLDGSPPDATPKLSHLESQTVGVPDFAAGTGPTQSS